MITEWVNKLESHNPGDVLAAKEKFHEQFTTVRDSWLVNGLYDYYLSSNSVRSMEILVGVPEPHHIHLFDKLTESIKGNRTEVKVQALTLLGHLLRKQPTWLYKIAEHQLLKEILKRLKTETEILPLLSALFVLIVLLPIIPSLMKDYLLDVFEIFSRLASWNCGNPANMNDDLTVHMQVALYALFQRLYGMYPCNFLGFLRNHYRDRNLAPIFTHTIKPLLDSVKMHPALVTASKDQETTTARWMKMGAHDVIVECERLSLDASDRCPHESCHLASFRSRSGTTTSTTYESAQPNQVIRGALSTGSSLEWDYFSPSMVATPQTPPVNLDVAAGAAAIPCLHVQGFQSVTTSQEGTSPPEAAIEATPETTPIKIMALEEQRLVRQSHANVSNVPKALTFNMASRARSMGSSTNTPTHSQPSSPMRKEPSPFVFPQEKRISAFATRSSSYQTQKVQRLMNDRTLSEPVKSFSSNPPSSPLRIIPNDVARAESPVSLEDEEVGKIVERGEIGRQASRECDSVLQETGRGGEDDLETCEPDHNSPCVAGGLHTLSTKSLQNFQRRMKRLRYHSQCASDSEHQKISTGSSPGDVSLLNLAVLVRRANSCPEMKKGTSSSSSNKDNLSVTLDETDEDERDEPTVLENNAKILVDGETQTSNIWPMPYEHLFLDIFPLVEKETGEPKPSPTPSPAPFAQEKGNCFGTSVYDILDRYIERAVNEERGRNLREQLQLLHQQLLFERHRRETHAFRNRRLLADARDTRALEEHNSALRDQVQLQQSEIDSLRHELELRKRERLTHMTDGSEKMMYSEEQAKVLRMELCAVKDVSLHSQRDLEACAGKCAQLDGSWQQLEGKLVAAEAEVKLAKQQNLRAEKMRAELERMNKELLLASELLDKYQEHFSELSVLRRSDQELAHYKEISHQEMRGLAQQVETKSILLDASKTRVSQLEQTLAQSEESVNILKKRLNEMKEEYHEKIKAVESKYSTQLAINHGLEEKILELWQTVECSKEESSSPQSRNPSPATSSCQEAQPTPPLSVSLSSLEGNNIPFLPQDNARGVQSLEALVDRSHETSLGRFQGPSSPRKQHD